MGRSLGSIVDENVGILLENEQGSVLLDRFGRRAYRLTPDTGAPLSEEARVESFLGEESPGPQRLTVEVHAIWESVVRDTERDAIRRILGSFGRHRLRLAVHFVDCTPSWGEVANWMAELRQWQPRPQHLRLTLIGPFGHLDEHKNQYMFNNSIYCQVAHGWWPGISASEARGEVRTEALEGMTAFGLQAPALWYIHGENIKHANDFIRKSLVSNHYSGFSVPLHFQSPYMTDITQGPPPPGEGEYAELLAGLYDAHPHYDRVFEPLFDIVEHAAHGGWEPRADHASNLRLLFSGDGQIRCFRHLPALAVVWKSSEQVRGLSEPGVRAELASFHRDHFSWAKNDYCDRCHWRYMCGGIEPVESEQTRTLYGGARNAVCEARMLFLEAFTRQRLQADQIPFAEA